jgi:hypothetical protein
MTTIGRTIWAIAGGRIPLQSAGPEPEFTSRDELLLLNAGEGEAHVELTIYYADRDPQGPYRLAVGARRVRCVRFNDLIDPEAMPLGVDYGVVAISDVPVVVQYARVDTSQSALALMGTIAFGGDH